VHALDTANRTAVCIDLDVKKAWGARLELRGSRLDVVGKPIRPLARIDTGTHKVISHPPAPSAERARTRSADASTSWLPLAAPPALLLIIAAGLSRRRMVKKAA
jgi:hypothetical protein